MRAMDALEILPTWSVPARELTVRFVRSSGPGGNNVNTVSTMVELWFAYSTSTALTPGKNQRLQARFPSQVNQQGELVLVSDETRSQVMNLESVRGRLKEMILLVKVAPKVRRPTRPSRAAKQRRLSEKRHRGETKLRRRPEFDS
jgi:ribosome-associated protein